MVTARNVQNPLQLGVNGNVDSCAGFALAHSQHPTADMLAANADNIAAPLSSIQQKRERKSRAGADWMCGFKFRNVVFGPGSEPVR
jgi:hypothetical protein